MARRRERRAEMRDWMRARSKRLKARLDTVLSEMTEEDRDLWHSLVTKDVEDMEPGELAFWEDVNSRWHLQDGGLSGWLKANREVR